MGDQDYGNQVTSDTQSAPSQVKHQENALAPKPQASNVYAATITGFLRRDVRKSLRPYLGVQTYIRPRSHKVMVSRVQNIYDKKVKAHCARHWWKNEWHATGAMVEKLRNPLNFLPHATVR